MRLKYSMLFSYRSNLSGESLGQRDGGWSESFYGDEGVTSPDFAAFRGLMRARAALLGTGARIVGQRYQIVEPTGGSSTGTEQFQSTLSSISTNPQVSLYWRMPCEGVPNQARIVVRGIPAAINREGEYNPQLTGWSQALLTYQRTLRGWRIKARDLQADQADILSIDDDGNMETVADFPADVGDMVRVLRTITEEGNRIGGPFKIQARASATSFVLKGWKGGITTKGRVRLSSIIYPDISNTTPALRLTLLVPRVIDRKVGRSFGSYRGRASARR